MKTSLMVLLTLTSLWCREGAVGDWEWRGIVARGGTVQIRGVTGDIHASPSSTGEVEVVARMGGPGKVEIRAEENESGVTIGAVRSPGSRIDYDVRIPSGVGFSARTVDGAIAARSLSGDVDATTVNGSVVVSTSGALQAHTVNGSINVSMMKPFWSKAADLSAVNGKIFIKIPTNVQSTVLAETKNGRIVANMPGFRGKATDQVVEGRIGGGGCSRWIVRTINGGIELGR